jgi:hypothetical protein
MEFTKIKNALSVEYKGFSDGQKTKLNEINTQEDLNNFLKWGYNKRNQYKGTLEEQKKKAFSLIDSKYMKEFQKKNKYIESVEESKDFNGEFIITLEWNKSKMWGSNPRAFTNYGFNGSSIGGCGYDKTSTATAQALNDYLPILKLLFAKEEERLNTENKTQLSQEDKERYLIRRAFIGYGSGYGSLPHFEGGVGVSCHLDILKRLGLYAREITSTNNTNVYLIRKFTQEEQEEYNKRGY